VYARLVPELPEVETVRRALQPALVGARVERASISDPRLTRPFDPSLVARELVGEHVEQVDRRGKYLIVRFGSSRSLVVHLRMTGSFRTAPRGSLPPETHTRAVLGMDNGSDVMYRDVRRFGTWELLEHGDLADYLDERLGPEPFERSVTARTLSNRLSTRHAPIKAVLLDQRMLAGLGNIYVDEALWWARINPRRPAASLDLGELARLVRATRRALLRGIERQGATLRDYARPDGGEGGMQDEFKAYGRGGEPCLRCRAPMVRDVVGGRGTSWCPVCQPLSG
jgi:formamidopyrimidine-DNA glycosylase